MTDDHDIHTPRYSRPELLAASGIRETSLRNWLDREEWPLYAHQKVGRGKSRLYTKGEVLGCAIVARLDRLAVDRDFSNTFAVYAVKLAAALAMPCYRNLVLETSDPWDLVNEMANGTNPEHWLHGRLVTGDLQETDGTIGTLRIPLGAIVLEVNRKLPSAGDTGK